MIFAALAVISQSEDLELVKSKVLESHLSHESRLLPDNVGGLDVNGELAKFRDSKGREYTVIRSRSYDSVATKSFFQNDRVLGTIVCRYNSDGVMDRFQAIQDHDFRCSTTTNHFISYGDGRLEGDVFSGEWRLKDAQPERRTGTFEVGGFTVSKPSFSLTEALFLRTNDPRNGQFSVVTLDPGVKPLVIGLETVNGAYSNQAHQNIPYTVVVSNTQISQKGVILGGIGERGEFFLPGSPNFLGSSIQLHNTNPARSLTNQTRVHEHGGVSDSAAAELKALIPEEWRG